MSYDVIKGSCNAVWVSDSPDTDTKDIELNEMEWQIWGLKDEQQDLMRQFGVLITRLEEQNKVIKDLQETQSALFIRLLEHDKVLLNKIGTLKI